MLNIMTKQNSEVNSSDDAPSTRRKKRKPVKPNNRIKIILRDNFICSYCLNQFDEKDLEIDHIRPVAVGGDDSPENLTTACRKCNQLKRGLPLLEQDRMERIRNINIFLREKFMETELKAAENVKRLQYNISFANHLEHTWVALFRVYSGFQKPKLPENFRPKILELLEYHRYTIIEQAIKDEFNNCQDQNKAWASLPGRCESYTKSGWIPKKKLNSILTKLFPALPFEIIKGFSDSAFDKGGEDCIDEIFYMTKKDNFPQTWGEFLKRVSPIIQLFLDGKNIPRFQIYRPNTIWHPVGYGDVFCMETATIKRDNTTDDEIDQCLTNSKAS